MMSPSQASIFDMSGLADLQRQAKERSPEANKAIAQQFEALFTQMILKSMRQSLPGDGLGGGENTQFYQGLQDQQLSLMISKKGGMGLAPALERMLNGQTSPHLVNYNFSDAKSPSVNASGISPLNGTTSNASNSTSALSSGSPQSFVAQLWPQAQDAARSLGVPPHFLVGQAALETGWGKSQLKKADGSPSYNLFNIKAGKNWTGDTVEATTTEYENGQAVTRRERFRAYHSYAEAFSDYAKLIGSSPRYANVVGKNDPQQFAQALQNAGYATDPAYAGKLARVINGSSMRQGMLASAS